MRIAAIGLLYTIAAYAGVTIAALVQPSLRRLQPSGAATSRRTTLEFKLHISLSALAKAFAKLLKALWNLELPTGR